MPHDELVMEIADDQVESGLPDGASMLHSWREIEVELGPAGKQKDLKRARKLLSRCWCDSQYYADETGPCPRADRPRWRGICDAVRRDQVGHAR